MCEKLTEARAYYLYMNTAMSMQQIAIKYSKTKQWISRLIKLYLQTHNITYLRETRTTCKICGSVDVIRSEWNGRVGKTTITVKEVEYTCDYCKNNKRVKCHVCGKIGRQDELVKIGGSWTCAPCQKKQSEKWYDKNRGRWNEYQREYRRTKKTNTVRPL